MFRKNFILYEGLFNIIELPPDIILQIKDSLLLSLRVGGPYKGRQSEQADQRAGHDTLSPGIAGLQYAFFCADFLLSKIRN